MFGTSIQEGASSPSTMPASKIVAIAANSPGCLGLKSDGTVEWVDQSFGYQSSLLVPDGLRNVTAIALGTEHALALLDSGRVVGWGKRPETGYVAVPDDLDDVIAIAAGATHSLALRRSGEVIGWGWDGFLRPFWIPSDLGDVTHIAAGDTYNLAVRRGGDIVFWGTKWVPLSTVSGSFHEYMGSVQREEFATAYVGNAVAAVALKGVGLTVNGDGTVSILDEDWNFRAVQFAGPSDVAGVTVHMGGIDRPQYALAVRRDGTLASFGWFSSSLSINHHRFLESFGDVSAVASDGYRTLYALKHDGTVKLWQG